MKISFIVLILILVCGTPFLFAQQPEPSAPSAGSGPEQTKRPDDWTSLSVASSHLEPQEPLLGSKDQMPGFTRELLQVEWRGGDPIDLYVIRPVGVAKPPAILYLYSYPDENDRYRDDETCRLLVKNGFAAVGFLSALTGHRYHDRPMREWFVSELQESLATSTHDVQMVLNYLAQRGDIDMDRIGMWGAGSGASIAILAAATDPRIKAVDLLNPWGDWPDWLAQAGGLPEEERADFLKPEFLKNVAPLDPLQWLPRLTSQAVRLQIIDDDPVTPKTVRERLQAVAPANSHIVHYETTEAFSQQAEVDAAMLDWLQEKLGSGAGRNTRAMEGPSDPGTPPAKESAR